MRKIAVVTGSRAEYGILTPLLKRIESHPKLELSLIVTGMHLSIEFGHTIKEIEEDGFKIDARVKMLDSKDNGGAMARSIGKCVMGMVDALEKIKPDMVLLLGDRGEMLAAAIAGAHMNILVVHLGGGDITGSIDESIRHAITKLSHIHFTSTQQSANRIIKMGEEHTNVHVVGALGLESILNMKLIEPRQLAERFNLDLNRPIILVTQHPVTTEIENIETQMKTTMEAIVELGEQTLITYPNADAGGRKIIKIIERYKDRPFIQLHKNLGHKVYLSLMKIASVMVGNSSSGLYEAPSFGLPVVNIGTRQAQRERAANVIDVGHDKKEIIAAIKTALFDEEFKRVAKRSKNPYGEGKGSEKIVQVLSEIEITRKLLQKRLAYHL